MAPSTHKFNKDTPIGVFDSGMGGLTVLRALEAAMPGQSFVYLGDTARLPYGTKSRGTVKRYALRASRELVNRGVGALVVACNTASGVALDALRAEYSDIPVFGVIEPGAAAACAVPDVRRVAVFATESTVRGQAYQRALLAGNPKLIIRARACQLLVALAEEGWLTGEVPEGALRRYVAGLLEWQPDVLLLGCTHFPVFRSALQDLLGDKVTLVDSAATTAAEVVRQLDWQTSATELSEKELSDKELSDKERRHTLLATDDIARFRRVGRYFLDAGLKHIELVDI